MAAGDPMIGSWNEVEMLATKAARGAGCPPAQAHRFGTAVAVHLAAGRDPALVATALDEPDRIIALALHVDRAVETASVRKGPVPLADPSPLLCSFFEALPCAVGIDAAGTGGATVTLDLAKPGLRPRPARVELPDTLADRMQTLAQAILVPETEESRQAGAGAGLTDGD